MDQLSNVPPHKQEFLLQLTGRLSRVPGMAAVVLGGSYAAGTQHEASDLDIGLYYFEARPFGVDEIRSIAGDCSVQGTPTVTNFYEWGPWVNGGAWIQTSVGKVDFLYRNLDQVGRTIDEAVQGIHRHDYGQQPASGFYSVIYLAEIEVCIPLYDPDRQIERLKHRVKIYPPKLKESIIQDSLWSAEFTLLHAGKFAESGDVYNTAGCLTRASASLVQALFALNEKYFMSDKKVMEKIKAFRVLPAGFIDQVTGILAHPGATPAELEQSVEKLALVWKRLVVLTADTYQPRFKMQGTNQT